MILTIVDGTAQVVEVALEPRVSKITQSRLYWGGGQAKYNGKVYQLSCSLTERDSSPLSQEERRAARMAQLQEEANKPVLVVANRNGPVKTIKAPKA